MIRSITEKEACIARIRRSTLVAAQHMINDPVLRATQESCQRRMEALRPMIEQGARIVQIMQPTLEGAKRMITDPAFRVAQETYQRDLEMLRPIIEQARLVEAGLRSRDMTERGRLVLTPRQLTIDDLYLVLRNRDKTGDNHPQPPAAAEPGNIAELAKKVPPVLPAENTFAIQGKVWTLTFAGITASCRDRLGLWYIAILLRQPNRAIRADMLRNVIEGQDSVAYTTSVVASEGEITDLLFGAEHQPSTRKFQKFYAGTILDDQAALEYKLRLKKLAARRSEAEERSDLRQLEEIDLEYDQIERRLRQSRDMTGKPRRFPEETEKARKSVGKAIHGALAEIESAHPGLHAHLAASIRCGTFLSYNPSMPVTWTT